MSSAGPPLGAAWRRVTYILDTAAAKSRIRPPMLVRKLTVLDQHSQRVLHWRMQKYILGELLRIVDAESLRELMAAAERDARAALKSAVEAFYWFDDVLWDYPPETIIVDNGRNVSLGQAVNRAHTWAHSAGELVGGLFGCRIVHDEDRWWRECQLTLMHNRVGQSPGFSVRYICNVCRGDPFSCPHPSGSKHSVVAERGNGDCSVCRRSACEHVVGNEYELVADVVAVDPVLHEVSLVPRPKDPLARITRVEISGNEVGRPPSHGAEVHCYSCLGPCRGIRAREEFESRQQV